MIAAKLNVLLGAIPTAAVSAAIQSADQVIGAMIVPPVGSSRVSPAMTDQTTATLDFFNTGSLGPGHCPNGTRAVETRHATWGELKSLYR